MNLHNAEFVRSVTAVADCPKDDLPQIAFAGKSNVGKSSVINKLLLRKNFARVGQAPGKTTHINFFCIDKKLYLVDLPGYGYAKVSQETKEQWGRMVERYLQTSRQLKAVFLLVDIRHRPGENDRNMYDWILHQGYQPIVIATKLDKIKRSQLQKQLKEVREGLDAGKDTTIIPFSAETKQGREEIYALLDGFLAENR